MGLDVLEPCSCLRVGNFKRYLKEVLKALSVLYFPKAVVKYHFKHHWRDAVKHHLKLFETRSFGLKI